MKIKLFILTYNNPHDLNETLKSAIYNTSSILDIYIINNHSNFIVDYRLPRGTIHILDNKLRPDFSTGYISRNWNQALILGFENLSNPKADIVVACQDDTIFYPNWLENLIELHKKYSFITYGWGDNFMSWTPEAVKRIGLWDERFLFGGASCEYFFRALLFNKDKSSINDYYHKRLLNPSKLKIADRLGIEKDHNLERNFNRNSERLMLKHKFPKALEITNQDLTHWSKEFINNPPREFEIKSYILYPYFERDVKTLKEQNYLC